MFNNWTIRSKIVACFLLFVVPTVLVGLLAIIGLYQVIQPFEKDIPTNLKNLSRVSYLDSLAQFIRYYDEVLTQSARNYVFTQDVKWRERYYEEAPKLEKFISEAIALGDQNDKKFFSDIEAANIALIKMEETAISMIDNRRIAEAAEILEGEEYWRQKDFYKEGLIKYVTLRGAEYDQALSVSTTTAENINKKSQQLIIFIISAIFFVIILGVLLALFFGLKLASLIVRPLKFLEQNARNIAEGNVNKRINIQSKDEIGQLAQSFNQMVDKLEESKKNIEAKVSERTQELEKLNKFMIDREIKMKELKQEIETLKHL